MIDRLRQHTRDGNDLYHLNETVVAVGQHWPDAARQVEKLRGRFYDQTPAPPADIFETVQTRDGRVKLWRAIPAGRFLMGSPETANGRYDWEGPQHEVVIASPFRLAAVPVTQAQYAIFDPDHRSTFGGEQRPVDSVTWYEPMAFRGWLASHGATSGPRLPTEEEWEYV